MPRAREPAHAAILLAAGASTRLGRAKQLIEIDGEPLLRRAARALLETSPNALVVVLGHDADALGACVADLPLLCVVARDHAEGLAASLRAGIAALPAECEGTLVALTDQPALGGAHLRALRDAWRTTPVRAAASAYAGVLGVPALLPRAWFADAMQLRGDTGARALLRARAAEVVAVAAPALAGDLDSPDDLARLR
ncbi:MAG: nucleotidyltransferase family protein [Dokdonella sp.]|uniref:nucleotidyltransferase family protein n=1 Tax=Dokdonella sp. TaxID=2291710 RepID=UPI003F82347D